MRSFCLLLSFTAACAPATQELTARSAEPVTTPESAEPASDAGRMLRRRAARLAPPFAGNPSTRRVDEALGQPTLALELAAAR